MTVKRVDSVVYEVVEDRAVLLHPTGKELLTLSVVGSMVWEELAKESDPHAIAAALLPRFVDVSLEQLEADVSAFLSELVEAGLVVPVDVE
jgi:hypothetical protein